MESYSHHSKIEPLNMQIDRINVVVRCRGNKTSSLEHGLIGALSDHGIELILNRHGARRSFRYDHIYDPDASQDQVFEKSVYPIVRQVMENNINGTVMAYGVTGSGKSHTMGLLPGKHAQFDSGMIPQSLQFVFDYIHEQMEEYSITISFVQLYAEQVHDLLQTGNSHKKLEPLAVRHNTNTGFYVEGLVQYEVNSIQEAMQLLRIGVKFRATASTSKNITSSRSHTIFQVHVKKMDTDSIVESTMCFVDLAGSERVHPSCTEQVRITEARYINKSLSALGSVISDLGQKEDRHIRFRDTNLTKLLENSFRGRGSLVLIATIDASSKHLHETVSTLKFASRCKLVKCNVQRNVPVPLESDDLRQEYNNLHDAFRVMQAQYKAREEQLHRDYREKLEKAGTLKVNTTDLSPIEPQLDHSESLNKISNDDDASSNSSDDPIQEILHQQTMLRAMNCSPENPKAIYSKAMTAAYYALCDITNRFLLEKVNHPALDSFQDEEWLMSYLTKLYSIVMDAMDNRDNEAAPSEMLSPIEQLAVDLEEFPDMLDHKDSMYDVAKNEPHEYTFHDKPELIEIESKHHQQNNNNPGNLSTSTNSKLKLSAMPESQQMENNRS